MRFSPVVCPHGRCQRRVFACGLLTVLLAVASLDGICWGQSAAADDGEIQPGPLLAATTVSPVSTDSLRRDVELTPAVTASPVESPSVRIFTSEPIEKVTVFINGRFVPPPLVVTTDASRVLVNGIEFPTDERVIRSLRDVGYLSEDGQGFGGRFDEEMGPDDDRPRFRPRRRDGESDRRRPNREVEPGIAESEHQYRPTRLFRTAHGIANMFESGRQVFAVFAGEPVLIAPMSDYGLELLSVLQSKSRHAQAVDDLLRHLPDGADANIWGDWLREFKPTAEFTRIVDKQVEFFDAVENENRGRTAAVGRLRSMSYPMSIAGLLLSVFAFGHVVSNKPPNRFTPVSEELSLESRLMVNRSLLLVVALSFLDLIWTILASQAKEMTELSPFGREFIHDPVLLGVFKFLMTGLGVGLLLALRRHRVAQTAAWWACLILTLLTMRWLTFNSMFA
ncbi:hypothetical protein GC176_00780 [bacterium]|nr:hypothetical protein [bacterium]